MTYLRTRSHKKFGYSLLTNGNLGYGNITSQDNRSFVIYFLEIETTTINKNNSNISNERFVKICRI